MAADSGARRQKETEREREKGEILEDQQLTTKTMDGSMRPEELGSSGNGDGQVGADGDRGVDF